MCIRYAKCLYCSDYWCWLVKQVHSTSKKLLYQLDHLVQVCNQPGTDRKHVNIVFPLLILIFIIDIKCFGGILV